MMEVNKIRLCTTVKDFTDIQVTISLLFHKKLAEDIICNNYLKYN